MLTFSTFSLKDNLWDEKKGWKMKERIPNFFISKKSLSLTKNMPNKNKTDEISPITGLSFIKKKTVKKF